MGARRTDACNCNVQLSYESRTLLEQTNEILKYLHILSQEWIIIANELCKHRRLVFKKSVGTGGPILDYCDSKDESFVKTKAGSFAIVIGIREDLMRKAFEYSSERDDNLDSDYENYSTFITFVESFIHTKLSHCRITWTMLANEVGQELLIKCKRFCAKLNEQIEQLNTILRHTEDLVSGLEGLLEVSSISGFPRTRNKRTRVGVKRTLLTSRYILQALSSQMKDVTTRIRTALPNDDVTFDDMEPGGAFERNQVFPKCLDLLHYISAQ